MSNDALKAHERLSTVLPSRVYGARPVDEEMTRKTPDRSTRLGRVYHAAPVGQSFTVADLAEATGLRYDHAKECCARLALNGFFRRLNAVGRDRAIYEVVR